MGFIVKQLPGFKEKHQNDPLSYIRVHSCGIIIVAAYNMSSMICNNILFISNTVLCSEVIFLQNMFSMSRVGQFMSG